MCKITGEYMVEDFNEKDLIRLIKNVEKANNGSTAKIISPERFRDALGETFYNRRVEYLGSDDELVIDVNKLYVIPNGYKKDMNNIDKS